MAITFHYKNVTHPDGETAKTPVIPITLYGAEHIDTVAILDSGADQSAMSASMAEALGLDLSGKDGDSFGIGGRVRSKLSTVKIGVHEQHTTRTFTIPVMVIYDDYEFPMLLGRSGFFNKYSITFDEDREKVTLKPVQGRRRY